MFEMKYFCLQARQFSQQDPHQGLLHPSQDLLRGPAERPVRGGTAAPGLRGRGRGGGGGVRGRGRALLTPDRGTVRGVERGAEFSGGQTGHVRDRVTNLLTVRPTLLALHCLALLLCSCRALKQSA